MSLDPHEKPPAVLREVFKRYQKVSYDALHSDPDVLDFQRGLSSSQQADFHHFAWHGENDIASLFQTFRGADALRSSLDDVITDAQLHAYSSIEIPGTHVVCANISRLYLTVRGLVVVPACIPVEFQEILLSRLLHRDLAIPEHRTNIHFHHDITYPAVNKSFFSYEPGDCEVIQPKDPRTHKPMAVQQFLNKKLRWITLGGQYNWTEKKYPVAMPPHFPADLSSLLNGLFPQTTPQAAIINLYSPGDVLSLHRDVSEECDKGLISLSVGCDGLFVLGLEDKLTSGLFKHVVLRLHSGDAVYMADRARFAWHGVPRIIPGTCPEEIHDWPATRSSDDGCSSERQQYQTWTGWMKTKRININVRQIRK